VVSGLLLRDAREVEIRRFDADDAEAVRACAAVYNAAPTLGREYACLQPDSP
jgi:hypothetical protein